MKAIRLMSVECGPVTLYSHSAIPVLADKLYPTLPSRRDLVLFCILVFSLFLVFTSLSLYFYIKGYPPPFSFSHSTISLCSIDSSEIQLSGEPVTRYLHHPKIGS